MQIYMQSERGEIEVFLCPDDDSNSPLKRRNFGEVDDDSTTETESIPSPIKFKHEPYGLGSLRFSPPPRYALFHSLVSCLKVYLTK